jgi:peptide/nickel transport system substrate-binding protein
LEIAMVRTRFARRVALLIAAFSLLVAACTTGGERRGGSIVIAAEDWPDCLNPVTQCSGASWAWYTVFDQVLPKAMELDGRGEFRASPLLVAAPSLKNGLLRENPFVLTYRINPAAVWADGTAITSADFDFTWRAILNTKGTYSTRGFDKIDSIDTRDPKTAVIKFKDPYVDWPNLFGGPYSAILEKAAFPSVNRQTPELSGQMLDSIPFSGGPWKLQSWSRFEAVLVPNERYWGPKPLLDRVRIVPILDQQSESKAFRDGKVAAVYPFPYDAASLSDQLKIPGAEVRLTSATALDELFFNNERPPMDERLVREAVMYAIDRDRIVSEVGRLSDPGAQVLNCGFRSFPNQGPWCRKQPFAQFTYDRKKAISALQRAGFDCSNAPAQPCSRRGKPLSLTFARNKNNKIWVAEERIMQESAKAAGIDLAFKDADGPELFGHILPYGEFHISHFLEFGADPSVTAGFACDQIPRTKAQMAASASSGGGQFGNWSRWCDREADSLMKASDREVDPSKRLELFERLYEIEAKDRISLPLLVLSSIGAWRSDQVAGPVGEFISSDNGMYYNLNRWSVP